MNTAFRHYKGGRYRLLGSAFHSDNEAELVIYESLQDGKWWARPKEEFWGEVDLPTGRVKRFVQENA